jgi:uncharacterized protein YndB with AHSA1/START domain
MNATIPEREITIERIIDAPRELVFAAWVQADELTKWWGPESFTVPRATSDPRPGGAFEIVMRGPDGVDYPVEGEWLELDPPARAVSRSFAVGPNGEHLLDTTTSLALEEEGGKTRLTLTATAVALVEDASAMLGGMKAGWTQSIRKLDDLLTGAAGRQVVMMRMIEAPPEAVFDAFTTREGVERWWGPDGYSVTTEAMDVRTGGEWRVVMHGPDGVDYPNTIVYEEISRPEQLAYSYASLPDSEDAKFRVSLSMDEFMGNTVLTMRLVFDSAEARDANVAKYNSIEGGSQTLARLAEFVATR